MNRTVILQFDTRLVVVVGALLVIVAVVLPWTSLPSFVAGDLARGGLAGGGLLTLVLAVLALLSLVLPWHLFNRAALPAAALGAIVYLVGLAAFVRVIQLSNSVGMRLMDQPGSAGSGLLLTFAGAVLMLGGGLAPVSEEASLAAWAGAGHRWSSYIGPAAAGVLLLSLCLCAWGMGWLTYSYTLGSSAQAVVSPTFQPVSGSELATPLVGVNVRPLGSVTAAPPLAVVPTSARAAHTPTRTVQAGALPQLSPLATATVVSKSSTLAATTTLMPARTPSPTFSIPTISGGTNTPTLTMTPTATSTPTLTPTPTATTFQSPQATPTLTATVTLTPTVQ